MAYTKQTWATGDTVTASKLNHMEDGIADAGGYDLVISVEDTDYNSATPTVVSGTWADCMAKVEAGQPITARVYFLSTYEGGATFADGIIYRLYCDPGYNDRVDIFVAFSIPTSSSLPGQRMVIRLTESGCTVNGTW